MLGQLLLVACCVLSHQSTGPNLQGTVFDEQGHPLSGARVDIATAAPLFGQGLFCPSCYPDCIKVAKTDSEGHFMLKDLDAGLKFRILVSLPGKKSQFTKLINPADGDIVVTLPTAPTDLSPEHTVSGRVVDPEGKPIEGALIEPYGAKAGTRRWWGEVKNVETTVTDNEGRFALRVPDDFLFLDIEVRADGYAGARGLELAPGKDAHTIQVPRGTSVSGKLLHEGKPLAGSRVSVVQVERGMESESLFIKAVGAVTDSEGRFEFRYLPADEEYVIFSTVGEGPQPLVTKTRQFTAGAYDKSRDLGSLETQPALSLAGRLTMPEGQSLPKKTKITLGRQPAWDLISVPLDASGNFKISGLPPETYEIRIYAKGLEIDGTKTNYQLTKESTLGIAMQESVTDLEIPLIAASPQTSDKYSKNRAALPKAQFVPNPGGWISGRVLAEGMLRSGLTVVMAHSGESKNSLRLSAQTSTDEEGRFRLGGLKTGEQYMINVGVPAGFSQRPWLYSSPYIHTCENDQLEAKLPDLEFVSGQQSLRGVVVDRSGKPLPGMTVSARLASGQSLPFDQNRRRPWIETDRQGSFELRELPIEPLQLLVYRANPAGGRIYYPLYLQPAINQQDVRITYDVELATPIEHLDGKAPDRRLDYMKKRRS